MTRDEAQALTKKILGFAKVPECEVRVTVSRRGFLRFARNQATTAGATDAASIQVTAWKGKRRATVTGSFDVSPDGLDEAAIKKLVADAEQLAAISPEDREYMPLLGPQEYAEVDAFDEETAAATAAVRAARIRDAIAYAKARKIVAAGFLDQSSTFYAVANSAELFAYFPSTSVGFSMTARTLDAAGSGYSSIRSNSFSGLDVGEAAAMAIRKAIASRGASELKPGEYPTILEAQAVGDLLPTVSFSARLADEGRSVFSAPEGKTRVGEKMFDERIRLHTDPAHPLVPASPIGPGGYPAGKADLVRGGVLKNLENSRYWAQQKKRSPGPFLSNLILEGEDQPLSKIIASTKRGVLVTRLWYIRTVDRQQALMTGLTRDGTFWIEDGEIARPIKNFRFNESMVRVLGEIEALGSPVRVGSRRGSVRVPPMRVSSFRFTSLSDAV